MKTDPKYGFYPWWPENGDDWVHPEDVALARELIPSPRVFRRDGRSGSYVVLHYGSVRLRVRRTLWQAVAWEGFDIGDWVEVLSRGMKNTPRVGVVREIYCHAVSQGLRYLIDDAGQAIPTEFTADDIRPASPTEPELND